MIKIGLVMLVNVHILNTVRSGGLILMKFESRDLINMITNFRYYD